MAERIKRNWLPILSAVVAVFALIQVVNKPFDRLDVVERVSCEAQNEVFAHRERIEKLEQQMVGIERDITYIRAGIDELKKRK